MPVNDEFEPSALDPALGVLIAALFEAGVLDGEALLTMARRLDLSDRPDLAESVRGIPLSCAFDTPSMRRAALHAVPDGGNADD